MNKYTVTAGKLEGTEIQARDEAHARKLLKSRLNYLKQKENKLTDLEKQLIYVCLDVMTNDWASDNLWDENDTPVSHEEVIRLAHSIISKLDL